MELLDRMQNKIGPLPTWAWIAIPAGGFVVLQWFRASRNTGEEVPVAENVSDSSEVDEYGINTGSSYLPSYGAAPGGSSQLPQYQTPNFDNLSWSKQAVNYLITEGVSAMDAATAINAYINGFPTTLNSTQFNALQKALTRFGPAPDGSTYLPTLATSTPTTPTTPTATTPKPPSNFTGTAAGAKTIRLSWNPSATSGVKYEIQRTITGSGRWDSVATNVTGMSYTFTTGEKSQAFRIRAYNTAGYSVWVSSPAVAALIPAAPAPKPAAPKPATPTPAAPAKRYHVVVRGDTLWALAQRYYGSGAKWPTIYNANKGTAGVRGPSDIALGTRLLIP